MAVESVIAVGLMAVVFVVVAQSMVSVAAQRRTSAARRAAQREAENVMERILAEPLPSLDAAQPGDFAPSAELLAHAPQAELLVEISPSRNESSNDEPSGRKVHVEVAWPDAAGRRTTQAALSAWKFGGSAPAGGEESP